MAGAPPRMLLLSGGGHEAFVALPITFDKAIQAASEKFTIAKADVRLTCAAKDMPWIGAYASGQDVYVCVIPLHRAGTREVASLATGAVPVSGKEVHGTDNDSYYYACAQKAVVKLKVLNDSLMGKMGAIEAASKPKPPAAASAAAPAATPKPAAPAGPAAAAGGKGKEAAPAGQAKAPAAAAAVAKEAETSVSLTKTDGKTVKLAGKVTGELAKAPPAGNYLGTLTIEDKTGKQTFAGKALGPNEILSKYVVHDQSTARLLFRPRSVRPQVNVLSPTETTLELSYYLSDWQILATYPLTNLTEEDGKTRIRWFLSVDEKGIVTDLMTGTQSSGLFIDIMPSVVAKPAAPSPNGPLIPAWPDVSPSNAFCLPQALFIPHMDRILNTLGVPVEGRTSMITAWLSSLMRHKHIGYRLLSPAQLATSIAMTMMPPPDVVVRIFVLFRGVDDAEMSQWADRGILHAEAGLDWKDAIGWDANVGDESLFRVIEYAFM